MIKKIDNVFIDGANRAFGGYIYSVEYEANYAEQPSTLKVTVVNETGEFNISEEDLFIGGAPTTIKMGKNITLYMYPAGFNYEDSPEGKTLSVEYIDESVVFLDKKVVKIRNPSKIENGVLVEDEEESYDNTIVLGEEDYRDVEINESDAKLTSIFFPGQDPRKILIHAPITYTFPQLLEKIEDITGIVPVLDEASSDYKKDYSGKLREVLSAWCNDLGLGFYWEDRKLNFIDLRNPANFSAVKSLSEQIKTANNVTSFSRSVSLRDTFSRGILGQLLENGSAREGTVGQEEPINYFFRPIKIDEIPWEPPIASYVNNSNDLATLRIKAAKYGYPFFITASSSAAAGQKLGDADITDAFDVSRIAVKKLGRITDEALLTRVTSGSNVNKDDYFWGKAAYIARTDLQTTFTAYEALANFYGRFYVRNISSADRSKRLFGDNVVWYPRRKLVTEIPELVGVLEPVLEKITGFRTISLEQFLNNGAGQNGLTQAELEALTEAGQISNDGYAIKEVEPVWTPVRTDTIVDFGRYVIIEGSNDDPDFIYTNEGSSFPAYYLGVKKEGEENLLINPDTISLPSLSPILIQSFSLQLVGAEPPSVQTKGSITKYIPPETSNVNYYDISSFSVSSENINEFGDFQGAFENYASEIPQQREPFFTSQITIPNIDAGGPSLKIGTGLQGFSISYSSSGVKTTYSIGTEKMKLRSADVFYRYVYDGFRKKQSLIAMSSRILSKFGFERIILKP